VRGEARLRPTSDRVRESLFNLLAHGDHPTIIGVHVLDLFAGVGALGLEALSRGAARAIFVDETAAACALVRRNVQSLGVIGEAEIWRRDATRLGSRRGAPCALVLADPPYGRGLGTRALASALAGGWVAPGATVILEEAAGAAPPCLPGLRRVDERVYGGTGLTIYRAAADMPLGSGSTGR